MLRDWLLLEVLIEAEVELLLRECELELLLSVLVLLDDDSELVLEELLLDELRLLVLELLLDDETLDWLDEELNSSMPMLILTYSSTPTIHSSCGSR